MRFQTTGRKACLGLIVTGFLLAMPSLATAAGKADASGAASEKALPATANPLPLVAEALPAAPMPAAASAQESQALDTLRLEPPQVGKVKVVRPTEEAPSRRKWVALAIAEHGAAAFDAYSTRQAIGRGAVEADPLMRPFAGSPGIYAVIQIAPLALDYAARRMQRSGNPVLRKMWWLPQTGGTAMYVFSGAHNLGVQGRP